MGSMIWVGLILMELVVGNLFQLFEVKDGSRVLFWHGVWCGDCTLKSQFLGLFRMAHFKDATIQEVVYRNCNTGHWNLTFMRTLSDWKEDSICSLLALLAGTWVLSQGNDEIVWPLNSKGSFTVKSCCST